MAAFATERLIQGLTVTPGLSERYQTDPEGLFDDHGIPEDDRVGLRAGTPPALTAIGLHPVLQIHYFIGTKSPAARHLEGSLLDRLKKD